MKRAHSQGKNPSTPIWTRDREINEECVLMCLSGFCSWCWHACLVCRSLPWKLGHVLCCPVKKISILLNLFGCSDLIHQNTSGQLCLDFFFSPLQSRRNYVFMFSFSPSPSWRSSVLRMAFRVRIITGWDGDAVRIVRIGTAPTAVS